MKIKLDENLSRHLKTDLSVQGHDVTTAAEEGLSGQSDVRVGEAAKLEGRMIFTLDVEFADLRKYSPGTHPGVILFRPTSMGPKTVNRYVLSFAKSSNLIEFEKCVVVVEPDRIRIRRPAELD